VFLSVSFRAGWPDEFLTKNQPKCSPNQFKSKLLFSVQKISHKYVLPTSEFF
jgi:hypothetical protein